MKYATKFMMVPYVAPISKPEDRPTLISNKLSTTLAQQGISRDSKLKAYADDMSRLQSLMHRGPSESEQLLDTNKKTLAGINTVIELFSKPDDPPPADQNLPPLPAAAKKKELRDFSSANDQSLNNQIESETKAHQAALTTLAKQHQQTITAINEQNKDDIDAIKNQLADEKASGTLTQTRIDELAGELRAQREKYENSIRQEQEKTREIQNALSRQIQELTDASNNMDRDYRQMLTNKDATHARELSARDENSELIKKILQTNHEYRLKIEQQEKARQEQNPIKHEESMDTTSPSKPTPIKAKLEPVPVADPQLPGPELQKQLGTHSNVFL
jgi:hypothetical protein